MDIVKRQTMASENAMSYRARNDIWIDGAVVNHCDVRRVGRKNETRESWSVTVVKGDRIKGAKGAGDGGRGTGERNRRG